jgi:hypothetical protein
LGFAARLKIIIIILIHGSYVKLGKDFGRGKKRRRKDLVTLPLLAESRRETTDARHEHIFLSLGYPWEEQTAGNILSPLYQLHIPAIATKQIFTKGREWVRDGQVIRQGKKEKTGKGYSPGWRPSYANLGTAQHHHHLHQPQRHPTRDFLLLYRNQRYNQKYNQNHNPRYSNPKSNPKRR